MDEGNPSNYGPQVNEWLTEHAKLNPIEISLRVGDAEELIVEPEVAEDVYDPRFEWILNNEGQRLAFIWYGLSKTGKQARPSVANGIALKIKGFTIGSRRETLKSIWPAVGGRTLYHHYAGEIHVFDQAGVFPNAARDNLESTPEKQILLKHLAQTFQKLSRQARLLQATVRARTLVFGLNNVIVDLKARAEDSDEDLYQLISETSGNLGDLTKVRAELQRQIPGPSSRLFKLGDLTSEQSETVEYSRRAVAANHKELSDLERRLQTETNRREARRAVRPSAQPPRSERILEAGWVALKQMQERLDDEVLSSSVQRLDEARRSRSIQRGVEALDDVKVAGIQLSDDAEAARKELRTMLSWSPTAPVSLEEALAESDVPLANEGEERVVRAIDRGLMDGLGGRGPAYEAALRSIGAAAAEEFNTEG